MAIQMQEVLAQYVAPILAQYAQQTVGLDEARSYKAIEKSIPAVLAGILNHVRDEHAAKRFFNLLTGTLVDARWLDADGLQEGKLDSVLMLGRQWQGLLFGNHANEVVNAVAQDAEMAPEQSQQILALTIPTVLAALKKWIQGNQYGQHQFYGQLVAQEPFLSKIFSPKLLAALGIPSALALVAGVRSWGDQYFAEKTAAPLVQDATPLRTTPPPVATAPTESRDKSGLAWVKWLLAAIVIGVLAWIGKSIFAPTEAPAPTPSTVASAPVASAPAVASTPMVASAASSAVAESDVGAASPAVASEPVVESADKVVYENNALKFYFATGSAKIGAQAKTLAEPLLAAAKEGKKLRVSGYNDKTGDAESNEWLAKKRAQAVRTFLRNQGVAAKQIELVKPANTTGQSGDLAQDRRVEVTIVTE